jgi:hypothetical protein
MTDAEAIQAARDELKQARAGVKRAQVALDKDPAVRAEREAQAEAVVERVLRANFPHLAAEEPPEPPAPAVTPALPAGSNLPEREAWWKAQRKHLSAGPVALEPVTLEELAAAGRGRRT